MLKSMLLDNLERMAHDLKESAEQQGNFAHKVDRMCREIISLVQALREELGIAEK